MAKMMGPRFKQCRRLGLNVCGHPKAMDRAGRGTSRADKKLSPYGLQLLEKQRLRAYYGVLEKQFRNYVKKAEKSKESTGTALIQMLECRLDNVVYRLGFARTRRAARQLVNHGHVLVNGNKVDIPSYLCKVGEVVSLREKSMNLKVVTDALENQVQTVAYVTVDKEKRSGSLTRLPERNELTSEINEAAIVEFYNRKL